MQNEKRDKIQRGNQWGESTSKTVVYEIEKKDKFYSISEKRRYLLISFRTSA